MRDNVSPEEKLLRLIRGQRPRQDKISSEQKIVFNVSDLEKTKPANGALGWEKFFYKGEYQKLIHWGFIFCTLYLFSAIFYNLWGLRKFKLPAVPKDTDLRFTKVDSTKSFIPLETYLNSIRQRSIFASEQIEVYGRSQVAVASDVLKDLSLVGIISGDSPQAIIEDKKANKTYYVTKGQYIGEFMVEDILEGKVIINRNQERFELFL